MFPQLWSGYPDLSVLSTGKKAESWCLHQSHCHLKGWPPSPARMTEKHLSETVNRNEQKREWATDTWNSGVCAADILAIHSEKALTHHTYPVVCVLLIHLYIACSTIKLNQLIERSGIAQRCSFFGRNWRSCLSTAFHLIIFLHWFIKYWLHVSYTVILKEMGTDLCLQQLPRI